VSYPQNAWSKIRLAGLRLITLCRPCHAQTDAPYARGRLIVTPLGHGQFHCAVIHGPDKWAIRA